ncbi:MAG: type II secretion system protein [Haloarculaceae archaeon]
MWRAVRMLASLSPRNPDPGDELAAAARFLGGPEAATWIRAADGAGSLVAGIAGVVAVGVALARPSSLPVALPLSVALVIGARYGVRALPVFLATVRRSAALGLAPALVARMALGMRVEPTPEAAVDAGRELDGPLGETLDRHARAAAGTGRTGLRAFADAWSTEFPSLGRACSLLHAAAGTPPDRRGRALGRATDAVLEGTRDRTASFATALRGPAAALYAFGVLLPTALVGVLPAARAAGLAVGLPLLALVYDVLLPGGLCLAGAWLLARRPVVFPARTVPRSHPERLPWRRSLGLGVGVSLTAGLTGALVLAPWFGPVAGIGAGVGAALTHQLRPAVAVRERVRELERELPDALSFVGGRVADGTAIERALADAADRLDGPAGAFVARGVERGERLGTTVEGSFGDALATLPSHRAERAVSLFTVAAREGPPAGDSLVRWADHLERLDEVEREARRDVARVAGTLSNTAAVFGPLVAGVTVGLAGRLAAGTGAAEGAGAGSVGAASVPGATAATTLPVGGLGLVVGGYVLWSAAVLPALAVGLERGFDPAVVGRRVGRSLPLAAATFGVAYALTAAIA